MQTQTKIIMIVSCYSGNYFLSNDINQIKYEDSPLYGCSNWTTVERIAECNDLMTIFKTCQAYGENMIAYGENIKKTLQMIRNPDSKFKHSLEDIFFS